MNEQGSLIEDKNQKPQKKNLQEKFDEVYGLLEEIFSQDNCIDIGECCHTDETMYKYKSVVLYSSNNLDDEILTTLMKIMYKYKSSHQVLEILEQILSRDENFKL